MMRAVSESRLRVNNAGEKAAAGFAPANSGQYFVSVDLIDGQEGSFCLVYSYK